MKIRILPLTLTAIGAALLVQAGTLIEGLPAVAQQIDREFGSHDRPWASDLTNAAAAGPVAKPAPAPAPPQTALAAAGASGSEPPQPIQTPIAKLAPATCGEPALLAVIAEQQDGLAKRARRLADAEAVLAASETRIGVQLEQLTATRRDVEGLMKQRSSLQEEDIRKMVAVYEAMKPRDAARIFNSLETDIVIDVLDRMAERRTAPIIAEMADEKAREVTRIIMQRRSLPGDRKPAVANAQGAAAAAVPVVVR
jgi:flagellar motility protein MotE (MotC chaperone)